MAIEIADFPINSMVISNSYVNVYQAGYIPWPMFSLTSSTLPGDLGWRGGESPTSCGGGPLRDVMHRGWSLINL